MGKYWYTTSSGKRKRTPAGVKREYQLYQSSSKAKAERAARNNARRSALRKGTVHKGDGKDVDHKQGVSAGNTPSNLRIMSASANRGRRQKSRRRGSRRSRYGN